MVPRTVFVILAVLLSIDGFVAAVYHVNPQHYPLSVKQSVCFGQNRVCRKLCETHDGTQKGSPYCNSHNLHYRCTCADGYVPKIAKYDNTVPWWKCGERVEHCLSVSADTAKARQKCLSGTSCGGLNVDQPLPSSTSKTPSAGSAVASSSKTSGSSSKSAGLSTGNKVGVAVGVGFGGLGFLVLFGVLLFFSSQRRRALRNNEMAGRLSDKTRGRAELEQKDGPFEVRADKDPGELWAESHVREMRADHDPRELPAYHNPVELDASSITTANSMCKEEGSFILTG